MDSIFDDAIKRYILLYMFLVRFNIFRNLEDEEITEGFEKLNELNEIYIKNIKIFLPEEIIEEIFAFNLIKNLKDYQIFQSQSDNFEIKLNKGVYIEADNVLFSEEALLTIIKPYFPVVTMNKIKKSLNTLRATMCQVSSTTHTLVHKYNEDYALDNDLYQIIFFLGNPYLVLRLERLIVDIEEKAVKLESKLEQYLKNFYPEVLKKTFLKKIEKAVEESNDDDLLGYIIEKSKKLPKKFNPSIKSELYKKWRKYFNKFLKIKYNFITLNNEIKNVKSFYSGLNQKMSYLKFIEEVTNNEEEISLKIKESLIEIREKLKEVKDETDIEEKELKLLNLDLEKEVIENEEYEEPEE